MSVSMLKKRLLFYCEVNAHDAAASFLSSGSSKRNCASVSSPKPKAADHQRTRPAGAVRALTGADVRPPPPGCPEEPRRRRRRRRERVTVRSIDGESRPPSSPPRGGRFVTGLSWRRSSGGFRSRLVISPPGLPLPLADHPVKRSDGEGLRPEPLF